jgi:hypothetical protein
MTMSLRERCVLAAMALGVALMLQPWWSGGMRTGFTVAALATAAHIVVSHTPERRA